MDMNQPVLNNSDRVCEEAEEELSASFLEEMQAFEDDLCSIHTPFVFVDKEQ